MSDPFSKSRGLAQQPPILNVTPCRRRAPVVALVYSPLVELFVKEPFLIHAELHDLNELLLQVHVVAVSPISIARGMGLTDLSQTPRQSDGIVIGVAYFLQDV